eukprot:m51a1_g6497 hypothetical protein (1355) ;mRNA; r:196832-202122
MFVGPCLWCACALAVAAGAWPVGAVGPVGPVGAVEAVGRVELRVADAFDRAPALHALLHPLRPAASPLPLPLVVNDSQARDLLLLPPGSLLRVTGTKELADDAGEPGVRVRRRAESAVPRPLVLESFQVLGPEAAGEGGRAREPRGALGGALSGRQVEHRRLAVILVHFKDFDRPACDVSRLNKLVWENDLSVADMLRRYTNGAESFAQDVKGRGVDTYGRRVDVYGPYTVPLDLSHGCATDEWATAADAAALSDGFDIAAYQHRSYILPRTDLCSWYGLGSVGCYLTCRTWITRCELPQVLVHELGHNLGLLHAASNYAEKGPVVEYGDPTSLMGNRWIGGEAQMGFNAPHMDQKGWLPSSRVLSASVSGVYTVTALNYLPDDVPAGVAQAVKIKHPDVNNVYWLSYYSSQSGLPLSGEMLVHAWRNSSWPTEFIGSYGVGRDFEDYLGRFSVVLLSLDDTQMTVEVVFGCRRGDLVLSALYSTGSSYTNTVGLFPEHNATANATDALFAKPGEKVNVTLVVSDTDSPLCQPRLLEFNFSATGGWTVDPSVDSLALWPRLTCNVSLRVVAPRVAANGTGGSGSGGAARRQMRIAYTENGVQRNATVAVLSAATECAQSPPDVALAAGTLHVMTPSEVTVRVHNRDSDACSVAASFSIADVATDGSCAIAAVPDSALVVDAGSTASETLYVTLRSAEERTCGVCATVRRGQWSRRLCATAAVNGSCEAALPVLRVPEVVEVQPRQSFFVPVVVNSSAARPWCPGRRLRFSAPALDKVFAEFTEPLLAVQPGAVQTTGLVVSVSDSVATSNVTVPIELGGARAAVNLRIVRPECSRVPLTLRISCPGVSDGSGPISCSTLLWNRDSWICPNANIVLSPPNVTGVVSSFDYASLVLFPANYTYITLTIQKRPNVTGTFVYKTCATDTNGGSGHAPCATATIAYGSCARKKPRLVLVDAVNNKTGAVAETVLYTLRLYNNDNVFCPQTAYSVAIEQPSSSAGQVTFNGGVTVPSNGAYRDISLAVQPSGQEKALTFTFRATSKANASVVTEPVAVYVAVNPKCKFAKPLVVIEPARQTVAVGAAARAEYNVTVTNKDEGECPPLAVTYSTGSNLSANGNVRLAGETGRQLLAGESVRLVAVAETRENTPVGPYGLSVAAGGLGVHAASAQAVYEVACPAEPEAPYDVASEQVTPTFSVAAHVRLRWRACESPVACCCPCRWAVLGEDGALLGVAEGTNFTDARGVERGRRYVYTVRTIDRRGVWSPQSTCRSFAVLQGRPADLTTFVVLVSLVSTLTAVGVLAAAAVVVFQRRRAIRRALDARSAAASAAEESPVQAPLDPEGSAAAEARGSLNISS